MRLLFCTDARSEALSVLFKRSSLLTLILISPVLLRSLSKSMNFPENVLIVTLLLSNAMTTLLSIISKLNLSSPSASMIFAVSFISFAGMMTLTS